MIYMYKQDLALNNLEGLIYHKPKQTQTQTQQNSSCTAAYHPSQKPSK